MSDPRTSLIPDNDDPTYNYRSLTDSQKTLLAILPIPSALLSIFGSTVIIYMAYKSRSKSRPWTPYNRLLVAMSIYDIITSIALGASPFLYPKETSNKALVYGNDASCTLIGFLNQLSYSGTLYNGFLSLYFLLTARFGIQNHQIARRIEPAMHMFSVGYPVLTGFIGLFLGVYSEPEVGLGCWVNSYPERCGYGPDGTGEPCLSGTIGWIFGGWVACLTLALLVVDNFIISWYVFRQTGSSNNNNKKKSGKFSPKGSATMDLDDDGESAKQASMASSFRSIRSNTDLGGNRSTTQNTVSTISMDPDTKASQRKRLKLVSSQAFLFVASYIVSNGSTVLLRLFESQAATYVEEMELPKKHYILMVLQASLLPLQGLFNMMVYIRPKYIKNRSDFPGESRVWAIRRAVWGADVVRPAVHSIDIHQNNAISQADTPRNERDRISSLTNTSAEPDRKEKGKRPMSSRSSFRSSRGSNSLEVIPEADNLESISDTEEDDSRREEIDDVWRTSFWRSQCKGPATVMMDGSILRAGSIISSSSTSSSNDDDVK
ncbi:unnamed protein product [Cylindrotheca closterium]|uniref:G-protein coupled receptors family 1 profile domain-containing protein n=1 Tax=Cylindrotheca closterium TaxID=2856 RepID=A0AAD2FEM8_9STRA|nr:unnamed protein product [Cylindrotheca closterium]